MSSGKQQQTSSTELPEWMRGYATNYLQRASDVSQKPYEGYGGQTVADLNPYTTQGVNQQAQLGQSGTQAGNAGTGLLTDTLQGKYLGSNPYLDQQIQDAQGDAVRGYNLIAKPATETAMANSGSFGNSGLLEMQRNQQSDFTRNLGRIGSDMRMNAYNTERNNQQQALGLAPTYNGMQFANAQATQDAGKTLQGQDQLQLSDAYQRWMQAQGYDANQLGIMGSALGNLKPGGTQTTTGSDGGTSNAQMLGSLALAAASIWSDRRLKKDVQKVGEMKDGTNVYTYRYKWGGPMQMGVMAQEVEKTHPEAVTKINGVRAVNYGLLGG